MNGRWFSLCAMLPKPMSARVSWLDGASAPHSTFAGTRLNAPIAAAPLRNDLLDWFMDYFPFLAYFKPISSPRSSARPMSRPP